MEVKEYLEQKLWKDFDHYEDTSEYLKRLNQVGIMQLENIASDINNQLSDVLSNVGWKSLDTKTGSWTEVIENIEWENNVDDDPLEVGDVFFNALVLLFVLTKEYKQYDNNTNNDYESYTEQIKKTLWDCLHIQNSENTKKIYDSFYNIIKNRVYTSWQSI